MSSWLIRATSSASGTSYPRSSRTLLRKQHEQVLRTDYSRLPELLGRNRSGHLFIEHSERIVNVINVLLANIHRTREGCGQGRPTRDRWSEWTGVIIMRHTRCDVRSVRVRDVMMRCHRLWDELVRFQSSKCAFKTSNYSPTKAMDETRVV